MRDLIGATRLLAFSAVVLFAIAWIVGRGVGVTAVFLVFAAGVVTVVAVVDLAVRRR